MKDMAAASTYNIQSPPAADRKTEGRAGSRRIFPPQFKLQVLEAYRRDAQCRGNQRATARKFGIHRRQIQKWLQAEPALRAALLRRAPQPAPSPPPYVACSPESARQPTPPPAPACTSVAVLIPTSEPIDLSLRRPSPTPHNNIPVTPMITSTSEPPQKPVKLFRPYLLEDEKEKRPPVIVATHVSAFSPVHGAPTVGCALTACPAPHWFGPAPAFPAPLR